MLCLPCFRRSFFLGVRFFSSHVSIFQVICCVFHVILVFIISLNFVARPSIFLAVLPHRISIPKRFLKCPKLERLDFWRMLPGLRPRATVVLGVHRGTFAQQKLCNRDLAVAYRQVQWRIASGAFSPVWPQWASGEDDGADAEALRMTTEVGGRLSSTDTTDKRTMHVLDSTSSKLFKAKKHAQTH